MIRAALSVYNDQETLEFTLASLTPWVDEILVLDGPYKHFFRGHFDPFSTDGSIEICEKYGCKILQQGVFPNQITKRNAFFSHYKLNDYCLVIDADEILFNGHYLDHLNGEDVYNVNLFTEPRGVLYGNYEVTSTWCFKIWPKPRLFKPNKLGLRYYKRHWTLLTRDFRDLMSPQLRFSWTHSGVTLLHCNFLHHGMKLQDKINYYEIQQQDKDEGFYGTIGKPFGFFDKTNCLKICKELDMHSMCINYANGYCLAHRQIIPGYEQEWVDLESGKTMPPDKKHTGLT